MEHRPDLPTSTQLKEAFRANKQAFAVVVKARNPGRLVTLIESRYVMMRRASDWRWATGTSADESRGRQAEENEWMA